jgi:hypothetical protein
MKPQEIVDLAYKVAAGVDRVVDNLEGWTPQEMLVLFAAITRGVVEHHPETRELAISQLSLALHKIGTEGMDGN